MVWGPHQHLTVPIYNQVEITHVPIHPAVHDQRKEGAKPHPFQAQTCSLGRRQLTGSRQCTCCSRGQCISCRWRWSSWPAMLEGCSRGRGRRERSSRAGGRWGGLVLCCIELRLPRIGRSRRDVRGVRVSVWGRRSNRLLRSIQCWPPCSEGILLGWLISYIKKKKQKFWLVQVYSYYNRNPKSYIILGTLLRINYRKRYMEYGGSSRSVPNKNCSVNTIMNQLSSPKPCKIIGFPHSESEGLSRLRVNSVSPERASTLMNLHTAWRGLRANQAREPTNVLKQRLKFKLGWSLWPRVGT